MMTLSRACSRCASWVGSVERARQGLGLRWFCRCVLSPARYNTVCLTRCPRAPVPSPLLQRVAAEELGIPDEELEVRLQRVQVRDKGAEQNKRKLINRKTGTGGARAGKRLCMMSPAADSLLPSPCRCCCPTLHKSLPACGRSWWPGWQQMWRTCQVGHDTRRQAGDTV